MSNSPAVTSLSCFVVPLQNNSMLIPNNTVAEVIAYEPLQRVQDTPDWFLGFLSWRGIQVPVVSFEMLTVSGSSFSLVSVSSASIVILRVFGEQRPFEYMAVVAQALPRLTSLNRHQLADAEFNLGMTELRRVKLEDELISIPDLDYLEEQIQVVTST